MKRIGLAICTVLALSACGSVMRKVQNDLAVQLTDSVLNHDDPDTVGAALPAYLLLLDAGASKPSADGQSLCTAAKLYGAYAGGFVNDVARQQRLAARAMRYATRGACRLDQTLCEAGTRNYEALEPIVAAVPAKRLDALACLGGAWASDVQARADQADAQADVPKVRLIYERIAAIDPNYSSGEAQMILGVMNSLLPPAVGGKPEIGAQHFEKAIQLSEGKNLMAKVLYAQYYARLVFEQELHDRLLSEVMAAPLEAPGLTLSNQIAKTRAAALIESGKDYF